MTGDQLADAIEREWYDAPALRPPDRSQAKLVDLAELLAETFPANRRTADGEDGL